MMKKALAVAVVLVPILVAALFWVDFDSPALGEMVMARAREATGMELSAERFRFNLVRGLVVEGVKAASSFPGGSYQMSVDRLVLEHRLLPLLSGKVSVERLLLEKPRVVLVQGKKASPPAKGKGESRDREPRESTSSTDGGKEEPATPSGGGITLEVDEIRLSDGAIVVRDEAAADGSATSIDGLGLDLRDLSLDPKAVTPLHGLSAGGEIQIGQVSFESTRVREARGQLSMGQGRFRSPALDFATDGGRFHAVLEVDFNRVPFAYTLALKGDPLDVNALAGAHDQGFGPGHLSLDAQGFGTDSRHLTGKGVLKLDAGRLPQTAILEKVETALGRTQLVGAPYQATEAPFRIEKNRLTLEHFALETDQAALELRGSVDLDGPLALNLVLRTPREGLSIKEVPAEVLDALTDDKGWVSIPLRVAGTTEAPQVALDTATLTAQARKGARKVLEKKATEELKGLIKRRFP